MGRGVAGERCQLTASPVARRFKEESGLNTLVADLFEAITAGTAAASLPEVGCFSGTCWRPSVSLKQLLPAEPGSSSSGDSYIDKPC